MQVWSEEGRVFVNLAVKDLKNFSKKPTSPGTEKLSKFKLKWKFSSKPGKLLLFVAFLCAKCPLHILNFISDPQKSQICFPTSSLIRTFTPKSKPHQTNEWYHPKTSVFLKKGTLFQDSLSPISKKYKIL